MCVDAPASISSNKLIPGATLHQSLASMIQNQQSNQQALQYSDRKIGSEKNTNSLFVDPNSVNLEASSISFKGTNQPSQPSMDMHMNNSKKDQSSGSQGAILSA